MHSTFKSPLFQIEMTIRAQWELGDGTADDEELILPLSYGLLSLCTMLVWSSEGSSFCILLGVYIFEAEQLVPHRFSFLDSHYGQYLNVPKDVVYTLYRIEIIEAIHLIHQLCIPNTMEMRLGFSRSKTPSWRTPRASCVIQDYRSPTDI